MLERPGQTFDGQSSNAEPPAYGLSPLSGMSRGKPSVGPQRAAGHVGASANSRDFSDAGEKMGGIHGDASANSRDFTDVIEKMDGVSDAGGKMGDVHGDGSAKRRDISDESAKRSGISDAGEKMGDVHGGGTAKRCDSPDESAKRCDISDAVDSSDASLEGFTYPDGLMDFLIDRSHRFALQNTDAWRDVAVQKGRLRRGVEARAAEDARRVLSEWKVGCLLLACEEQLRASLESSVTIPNENLEERPKWTRRAVFEWRSFLEEQRFLEMVSDVVKQPHNLLLKNPGQGFSVV
ncbi:hypothetical protein T484DRAFT_1876209 [Baffinella frigidus]|nr:hypothetical protein T484DRAFT_1876209 [Cryptophyta sp. CCMP2293]